MPTSRRPPMSIIGRALDEEALVYPGIQYYSEGYSDSVLDEYSSTIVQNNTNRQRFYNEPSATQHPRIQHYPKGNADTSGSQDPGIQHYSNGNADNMLIDGSSINHPVVDQSDGWDDNTPSVPEDPPLLDQNDNTQGLYDDVVSADFYSKVNIIAKIVDFLAMRAKKQSLAFVSGYVRSKELVVYSSEAKSVQLFIKELISFSNTDNHIIGFFYHGKEIDESSITKQLNQGATTTNAVRLVVVHVVNERPTITYFLRSMPDSNGGISIGVARNIVVEKLPQNAGYTGTHPDREHEAESEEEQHNSVGGGSQDAGGNDQHKQEADASTSGGHQNAGNNGTHPDSEHEAESEEEQHNSVGGGSQDAGGNDQHKQQADASTSGGHQNAGNNGTHPDSEHEAESEEEQHNSVGGGSQDADDTGTSPGVDNTPDPIDETTDGGGPEDQAENEEEQHNSVGGGSEDAGGHQNAGNTGTHPDREHEAESEEERDNDVGGGPQYADDTGTSPGVDDTPDPIDETTDGGGPEDEAKSKDEEHASVDYLRDTVIIDESDDEDGERTTDGGPQDANSTDPESKEQADEGFDSTPNPMNQTGSTGTTDGAGATGGSPQHTGNDKTSQKSEDKANDGVDDTPDPIINKDPTDSHDYQDDNFTSEIQEKLLTLLLRMRYLTNITTGVGGVINADEYSDHNCNLGNIDFEEAYFADEYISAKKSCGLKFYPKKEFDIASFVAWMMEVLHDKEDPNNIGFAISPESESCAAIGKQLQAQKLKHFDKPVHLAVLCSPSNKNGLPQLVSLFSKYEDSFRRADVKMSDYDWTVLQKPDNHTLSTISKLAFGRSGENPIVDSEDRFKLMVLLAAMRSHLHSDTHKCHDKPISGAIRLSQYKESNCKFEEVNFTSANATDGEQRARDNCQLSFYKDEFSLDRLHSFVEWSELQSSSQGSAFSFVILPERETSDVKVDFVSKLHSLKLKKPIHVALLHCIPDQNQADLTIISNYTSVTKRSDIKLGSFTHDGTNNGLKIIARRHWGS